MTVLDETNLAPRAPDLLGVTADICREELMKFLSRDNQPTLSKPTVTRHYNASDIENALCAAVIGQDHAARTVAEIIALRSLGLDPRSGRPAGVFLLTGPTGVGKTEFANALGGALTARGDRVLRIDCSEYSEPHQVARLLGAPPSYIGFGAPSPLEEFLKETNGGVLLLDEFEKGDVALHRLCLQVFDGGRLTVSKGRTLNLSSLAIIATTNIRSNHMLARVGFGPDGFREENSIEPAPPMRELKRVFADELLNRFDAILAFRPLAEDTARRILRERLLPPVKARIWDLYRVRLEVDDAVENLVLREGVSEEFGARHLQRAFMTMVLQPAAKALATAASGCHLITVVVRAGGVQALGQNCGSV